MKGFIIDRSYFVDEEGAKLVFIGRLENKETFKVIKSFKPYIFIEQTDAKSAEDAVKRYSGEIERTKLKNLKGKTVSKITLLNPKDVPKLRKELEEKKIICYEADIRFTQRFLMDNNILSSMNIIGKSKKGMRVNRIFEEPELKPVNTQPELNVLSLDIETDIHAKKIYAISLYSNHLKETIIVSNKKLKRAVSVKDEKELLQRFKESFLKADPDIVTGWNVINFDLNILKRKFLENKIRFDLGRTDEECRIRIERSFFKESSAYFPGRVVMDGIMMLKAALIRLEDYKLNTAAKEFLGESKLIGEANKGKEIEDAFKNNPQKLADYNLKDAKLVIDILASQNVIALMRKRSELTGLPLDRVRASIASFDSLYLRELRKRGYIAGCASFKERAERVKGGFVMKSRPGIYRSVAVLDFKSLYPSIIRTFNIDPLTYAGTDNKKACITAPNGACFKREEGILPGMIQKIWLERDKAKKRKDAVASYALKTIMNSFYGVLASPNCRFYNLNIANAITHFARFFIQKTAEEVKGMGYEVIYGDTDSIFVALGDKKNPMKIAEMIQDYINKAHAEFIKDKYKVRSFLELEAEKVYSRFLMPRIRGSEVGAKKRYAGLLNGNVDIVGLEFVRRDWTDLAKTFQMELLKKMFADEKVENFIKRFVEDLKKGKYDALLVYRKAIRKDISEYVKTTPPHVKAAKKIKEPLTSNIIEYVMTRDGPEPLQNIKHRIDYDHYIEKQLKPIADSILVFFKTNFDDVLKGSKQKTLGGF